MSTKRNLRPRSASQYASQQEWNLDEDDVLSVRRFNALEKFKEDKFNCDRGLVKEMKGEEFTLSYIQEHGLTQPLVFREAGGLGMKFPLGDFTVQDVKRLIGPRRVVDVMDTRTQEASTMTLGQWTKYYTTKPRQKLLNVISLEFSCTRLDPLVMPPSMVSQLDWVELMWPAELKDSQTDPTNDLRRMMYPKVQKYCLMSVAGCYTDFHIDFGGTSVWYHVLKGEKLFLLIPPSMENYDLFQTWHMSGDQESTFFAELVREAQLIRLLPGDTFIMPSGWIHAVYTPVDSLVFGGNFLHSFNIAQQLRVAAMENLTKVPLKFRYPFYGAMHWYVVERYHSQLSRLGGAKGGRSTPSLPSTEQEGEEEEDVSKTLSLGVQVNRKWLKGVTLKKVQVGTKKGSADLMESHTLPFLSVYEREGLLALIQEMLKSDLFIPDAPPTYADPKEVLRELRDQLQCSNVERTCALRPTGVGVVSPLAGNRQSRTKTPQKRKRKIDKMAGKGVKVEKIDKPTTTRKANMKRKRKPLVVSVPKSFFSLSNPDVVGGAYEDRVGGASPGRVGEGDNMFHYGSGSVCSEVREADETHDSQVMLRTEEQMAQRTESEQLARSECQEGQLSANVCGGGLVVPVLLTPPLSLSSIESNSRSPSPCPSHSSSPCTPSSQSFRLILELDSPVPSSSQTTPLHCQWQQNFTPKRT